MGTMRNDDSSRGDVDDGDAPRGADEKQHGNQFLQFFNGIHVDCCRVQFQKGPTRSDDGIAGITEIPGCGVPQKSQPGGQAECLSMMEMPRTRMMAPRWWIALSLPE